MKENFFTLRTVMWDGGRVKMIDQTLLPGRLVYRSYDRWEDVADAIRRLVVRGAPAIGVAAAMGIAAAAVNSKAKTTGRSSSSSSRGPPPGLRATRPTAVNLFWGIDRVMAVAARSKDLEGAKRGRGQGGRPDGRRGRRRLQEAGEVRGGPHRGRRHGHHAVQRGRARHRGLRDRPRRGPGGERAGQVRQGDRPRDQARPPGLEAHRLRALQGRVQLHDNLRHCRRVDDAVREGRPGDRRGGQGHQGRVSSSTRSGPTRSRSLRSGTGSPSTPRRPPRAST